MVERVNAACAAVCNAWAAARGVALVFLTCLTGGTCLTAASVTLAWDGQPDATSYVVWCGPAGGDYDRAVLTTNATCQVANLQTGRLYRFGVTAHTRENGSDTVTIEATPRASLLVLEWAPTPDGPWTGKATNMVDAGPGFYRGRVEIR